MARKPDEIRKDIKETRKKSRHVRRRLKRIQHYIKRHWVRLRHGRAYRKRLKADLAEAQKRLDAALKEGHDPGDQVLVDLRKQIQMLHHRLETNWDGNQKILKQLNALRKIKKNRWGNLKQVLAKRRALKRELRRSLHAAEDNDNFTVMDGKPVPEWIAGWLVKAKENGWHGVLVSGYRTPEYSEQLCYGICGRPSCSGLCAGRSSHHCCPPTFTGVYHEGAADTSDYITLGVVLQRLGSPLHNALPSDRVHFSFSGG